MANLLEVGSEICWLSPLVVTQVNKGLTVCTDKLFDFVMNSATSGEGPEVYAELLTKNMSPYVTTQVINQSFHVLNPLIPKHVI